MAFRFLVNEGPAARVFRDALQEDLERARLSLQYRAYYGFARPIIPIRIRQWLQGRSTGRPGDFYPDQFMERLADALRGSEVDLVHPWPHAAGFGFALTHDVESAEGLRLCPEIAAIEEDLGFRSVYNIVPYGYPIDRGIVDDLLRRGFEIGIHGYNHDGRLFTSLRTFRRRVPAMNRAVEEYGAVGFRAPMVHRNIDWLQTLRIRYDSSFFDSDPFQAMPGGVGTIWPFMAGDLVELPYTLPQDHTLFVVFGESDGRIWREKLQYVLDRAGLVLMLTHPEYLAPWGRLDVYRSFLAEVQARGNYWHALPKEIARWWRLRDASDVDSDGYANPRVVGPAAAEGAVPARFLARDGAPGFELPKAMSRSAPRDGKISRRQVT